MYFHVMKICLRVFNDSSCVFTDRIYHDSTSQSFRRRKKIGALPEKQKVLTREIVSVKKEDYERVLYVLQCQ